MKQTHNETKQSPPRLSWSLPRLALALDLSTQFLRKEIREGRLRAIRVGERRILVSDVEIKKYLSKREVESANVG